MDETKTPGMCDDIGEEAADAPSGRLCGLAGHTEAYLYIFYFNVLVSAILSTNYLAVMPGNTSLSGWVAVLVALISNSLFLNFLVSLVFAPMTLAIRRKWFTIFVLPLLFGLLNSVVYVDTVLYRLYRFHFNGMIIGMLLTPKAGDNFTVGRWTHITGGFLISVIVAAEYAFTISALPRLLKTALLRRLRRKSVLAGAVALIFIVTAIDKTIYAWADITDRVEYMRGKSLFPLYQAVTAKRWAKKHLGVEVTPRVSLRVDPGSSSLNYPKAPLVFGEGGQRPNVVIIIIESLRFDMLHPDIMPNLWKWGQDNVVAERHFTSGNRSTHGVFGIMYGLNATYWNRVLAERAGPVMVRELKRLGYTFKILSSTETIFIEAPKTSFVEIREVVEDHWTGELPADQRDVIITDKFLAFLKENRQPFFAYIWYDGSHQPYRYPAEHAVFPVKLRAEEVNYVKLASDRRHGAELFNRYKNSVHCVDAQAYRIISGIRDAGMLENTLIFVVGDHGEEFGEDGYFGHGSQFNVWQASTPMVAHLPGVGARKIKHITSHVDIVPTVLEYVGVTNPPSDYSHGVSLLGEKGQPFALIGGWDNCAIVDKDTVTVFGLEAYNADITVMDYDCQPLPDQDAAIAERQGYLVKVLEMFRQFTK